MRTETELEETDAQKLVKSRKDGSVKTITV